MSTMGIVYCNNRMDGNPNGEREQLMLLRTLQDNERNIIGNNNRTTTTIQPKNNVSVINVNTNVNQQLQQNTNEQSTRRTNQQQQNNVMPPYDTTKLKKHGKTGQPPPIAAAKRNARERNRVKQVNNGFATLRQHIPSHVAQGYGDRGKKLSKVETLRMAVEYIRGLQRLLAEADGLDYDAISARNQINDSSMMIPSPTGSVYSSSTHNGSGDVLCLAGSELDEQHSAGGEGIVMDEGDDGENYLMDEEDDEEDKKDRRDSKRFRDNGRSQNRLSENLNHGSAPRRRRNSPSTYYTSRQTPSFGDEENIEPLTNRNNNNNSNNNNNNLLTNFSPILLQTSSPVDTTLPPIKREIRLMDDEESRRSPNEDDSTGVILTSASPYAGEILIENPETGRFIPLKLEDPDTASGQFVYLAASADGLPATYYKHEIAEGNTEFMDVVSWWEQEQGRIVNQLQGHHHHVVQHQPQQQITATQQRLAHV